MKLARLVGDTACGVAPMLGWMVNDKQIEPHVPVWDRSERDDGSLSSSDFAFEAKQDRYRCPSANSVLYRSSTYDCNACPLISKCCPNTPQRKIARSIHEPARDVARAIAVTDAYKQSRKYRKKIEILFAHLKRILKLERLRLRGLSGAQDEFLLAATAQNLRRMAKWLTPVAPEAVPVPS